MAAADYKRCDICDRKTFYDADVYYDDKGTGLPDSVGDWAVLCTECAKTHRVVIEPRD